MGAVIGMQLNGKAAQKKGVSLKYNPLIAHWGNIESGEVQVNLRVRFPPFRFATTQMTGTSAARLAAKGCCKLAYVPCVQGVREQSIKGCSWSRKKTLNPAQPLQTENGLWIVFKWVRSTIL